MLIDLLAIKTILSFFCGPLLFFSIIAGPSALIGLAALTAWIVQDSSLHNLVFFSIGLLYSALAAALVLWGVLGELVYRTGNLKLEHFARIKSNHQT